MARGERSENNPNRKVGRPQGGVFGVGGPTVAQSQQDAGRRAPPKSGGPTGGAGTGTPGTGSFSQGQSIAQRQQIAGRSRPPWEHG